jgi:hypothetical protein
LTLLALQDNALKKGTTATVLEPEEKTPAVSGTVSLLEGRCRSGNLMTLLQRR